MSCLFLLDDGNFVKNCHSPFKLIRALEFRVISVAFYYTVIGRLGHYRNVLPYVLHFPIDTDLDIPHNHGLQFAVFFYEC